MRAVGVQTKESKGNFRDVIDVLADFEKGLKGKGTADRAAALATVFGARAVTGVNILLKEGTGNLSFLASFRDIEARNLGRLSLCLGGVAFLSRSQNFSFLKKLPQPSFKITLMPVSPSS